MSTTVQHGFDHTPSVYAPGETILLTVSVTPDDPAPVMGKVTTTTIVTLPDGTTSDPIVTESAYVVDAAPGLATTTVTSDTTGRTWVRVSDTGTVAVFRTVA